MSYIALYRKLRPNSFDDMVEQEHIVKTLKNAVQSDRIAHAYLFCGTRGTGKTTAAKIFARAVNCINPSEGNPCNECEICKGVLSGSLMDVVEIDAASNNSVDNVREIKDEVMYMPSKARYRVYIIDEVHMLSIGAFNALLKTLEEPPAHVIFILATTEPHKLPATILSRCQRYDFKRISIKSIAQLLGEVAEKQGVKIDGDALLSLAKLADGALRDGISLLDQCMATGLKEIKLSDINKIIGTSDQEMIFEFASALVKKDINQVLDLVNDAVKEGKDMPYLLSQIIEFFRNMLILKVSKKSKDDLVISQEEEKRIRELANMISSEQMIYILKEMSATENQMKWSMHPSITLELLTLKICTNNISVEKEEVAERITLMEERISNIEQNGFKVAANSTPVKENDSLNVKSHTEAKTKQSLDESQIDKLEKVSEYMQIIDQFKNHKKMLIYTYMLNSELYWMDENTILIKTDDLEKIFLSKNENKETIQTVFSKFFGRNINVRFNIAKETNTSTIEDASLNSAIEELKEKGVKVNMF